MSFDDVTILVLSWRIPDVPMMQFGTGPLEALDLLRTKFIGN